MLLQLGNERRAIGGGRVAGGCGRWERREWGWVRCRLRQGENMLGYKEHRMERERGRVSWRGWKGGRDWGAETISPRDERRGR